jgi:hypothetical protein
MKQAKRKFRIEDNVTGEGLVLIDETDTVVRVDDKASYLAELAFSLGADEVAHNQTWRGIR